VLTSAFGGAGRFTGGEHPGWEALHWPDKSDSPHKLEAWLIKGAEPVKSPAAVNQFQRWRYSEESSYQLMSELSENTANLSDLLHNGKEAAAGEILECISNLSISGIKLGEEIGVPAIPILPGESDIPLYRRESLALKCLGAGNETVLLLLIPDSLRNSEKAALKKLKERGLAVPLKVEHEGLRSELHSRGHE